MFDPAKDAGIIHWLTDSGNHWPTELLKNLLALALSFEYSSCVQKIHRGKLTTLGLQFIACHSWGWRETWRCEYSNISRIQFLKTMIESIKHQMYQDYTRDKYIWTRAASEVKSKSLFVTLIHIPKHHNSQWLTAGIQTFILSNFIRTSRLWSSSFKRLYIYLPKMEVFFLHPLNSNSNCNSHKALFLF